MMIKLISYVVLIFMSLVIIGCGGKEKATTTSEVPSPAVAKPQYTASETPSPVVVKPQYAAYVNNNTKTGFPIDIDVIKILLDDGNRKKFDGYKRFQPEFFLNNSSNYPCVRVTEDVLEKYGEVVTKSYVSGPTIQLIEKSSYKGNPLYGISCNIILVQEPKSRVKTACGTLKYDMVVIKENNTIKVYQALDGFNFNPNDTRFFKKADDMLYKIGLVCCDFLGV